MSRAVRAALALIVVATILVSAISGCGSKSPVFVDRGASYDKTSALVILGSADGSALAAKPTSEGGKLRHSALAALRRKGASASSIADLLTTTFPSSTSGVPIYVERATFGGQPAIVVVEATGPDTGTLSSKRIWVISDKGDILFAGSR